MVVVDTGVDYGDDCVAASRRHLPGGNRVLVGAGDALHAVDRLPVVLDRPLPAQVGVIGGRGRREEVIGFREPHTPDAFDLGRGPGFASLGEREPEDRTDRIDPSLRRRCHGFGFRRGQLGGADQGAAIMKPGPACDRRPLGRARPGIESDEDGPRDEGRRSVGVGRVAGEAEQNGADDPRTEDPYPSQCGDVQNQDRPTQAAVESRRSARLAATPAIRASSAAAGRGS